MVSLFCTTPFDYRTPQVLDIRNHMPSQAWNLKFQIIMKFVIKQYKDNNTLWVKHATYQKAESLRAASLSKLDNTIDKNSIFNTKYAENYLQNGRCSFIFTILLVHKTTPKILTKNRFLYFRQFSPFYSTFTCSQNHPYNPH